MNLYFKKKLFLFLKKKETYSKKYSEKNVLKWDFFYLGPELIKDKQFYLDKSYLYK